MWNAIMDGLFESIDYQRSDEYIEAERWYEGFEPGQNNDDHDYSQALNTGLRNCKELRSYCDAIETKAQWTFTLASAVAVLVVTFNDLTPAFLLAAFPSLLALLVSMIFSMRARSIVSVPTPYTVQSTVERIENTNFPNAWQAASLHCAATGYGVVNDWKGRQIDNAARFLCVAIAWLVIVMLCWATYAVCLPTSPSA